MNSLLDSMFDVALEPARSPDIALGWTPSRVELSDVLTLITHNLSRAVEDNDQFHQQLRDEGTRLAAAADERCPDVGEEALRDRLRIAAEAVEGLVESKENSDQMRLESLAAQIDSLRAELREAHELAKSDPLTGVLNRGGFDASIRELVQSCAAGETGFAMLMFDIDDFKQVNDRFGHQAGDQAIRIFTQRCRSQLRPEDRLARYGGEEFAVLMENVSLEQATARAEQIRQAVAQAPFKIGRNGATRHLTITVSVGVSLAAQDDDVEAVVGRADEALYLAKRCGKNCAKSEHELWH